MSNKSNVRKKPLILIADDSKYMRLKLYQKLISWGYDVIEAENGIQVLALFEKLKPDIILIDFMMTKMDGVSACIRLRDLPGGERTPIIMITVLEDEKSVDRAFDAGATDYINKPIHWAVLRQRINRLLQARYTEISLNQSEAYSSSIINHALDGIITVDKEGIIQSLNPAAEHLFGFKAHGVLEKNINILIPEFSCTYEESFLGVKRDDIGCKKDGSSFPIELAISKFYVGPKCIFTIILRDTSERQRYEEMMQYQAFHDSLTGLPNRILLKERFELDIAHAKRNNTKLVILYIDLDRFKLINDTLGHDAGDQLLKIVAERLISCVRADDTVARIGGDEFTMLLSGLTQEESVGKVAQKILEAIKQPVIIAGHELYLTGSIGITLYPNDGLDPETLLKNADVAMYRAKEKGKNNFQLYAPSMNKKAIERLEMENSLRRALEYQQFEVFYQPKIDCKTEKVIGMEALVRWQHPSWGMISPDKFIPFAEDTGLIIPIGEWVLRTACAQTKLWHEVGFFPLSVAVNLSACQFQMQDLTKIVSRVLKEISLSPEFLELEITESIVMQEVDYAMKMMYELKEMGIQFAIDDFGTGYSSLSYLNRFPISKLKIDKSFVSEINEHKANSVIASTVLALGKSLNLKVVAEGVETIKQLNFLKENQCDEMQGYLFGKPMSVRDFEVYYKKLKNNN